jgi:hypothetical protein
MAYIVTEEHERSTGEPREYVEETVVDLSCRIEDLTGMSEDEATGITGRIEAETRDDARWEWTWRNPEDGNHVVWVRKAS